MAKLADYCIVPSAEKNAHMYGVNGEWLNYEYRDGAPDWNKMSEEEDQWFCDAYNAMLDKPKGDIMGAILKWGRGDGNAVYQVVEVNPRSVTIAFVDMGDGYNVEDALIRGLSKSEVVTMVEQQKGASKLFGRAKTLKEQRADYDAKKATASV